MPQTLYKKILSLLILSTLIPASTIGMYGIFSSTQAIYEVNINRIKKQNNDKVKDIEAFLNNTDQDLRFLMSTPALEELTRLGVYQAPQSQSNNYQDVLRRANQIAKGLMRTTPGYKTIRYVDAHGHEMMRVELVDHKSFAIADENLKDQKNSIYFQEARQLKPDQVYISPVVFEPSSEEIKTQPPVKVNTSDSNSIHPVLYYEMAFFNQSGALTGAAVITLDLSALRNLLESSKIDKNYTYLIDSSGRYLFNSPRQAQGNIKQVYPEKIVNDILSMPESVIKVNQQEIISSQNIASNTNHKLVIFQVSSTDIVLAPINSFILVAIAVIVGSLGIVLMAGIPILRRIAKYQNQLYDQIQNVAAIATKKAEELAETLKVNSTLTEHLQSAKEAAEVANQAKSEFLANMSHELRTPLNGILGYAQILQRAKELTPKHRKGIDIIEQAGSHLLTLINDILDLSKIEAGKMELLPRDFHLGAFLSGIAELNRVRAESKGINFYYLPDPEMPTGAIADEKRLRQVLINLVGNAVKFTDRGHVTLETKVLEKQPKEVMVRFTITDTGVGMKPEHIANIFLPFEQVGSNSKRTEGTGLGLTICTKIVQMMGSKIELTSNYGQGSKFWLDLKLGISTEWISAASYSNKGTIIGYSGEPKKLLVVDDKEVNREVLVEVLRPLGFVIEQAENGAEALEKTRSFQPDLIITDIAMPVMDGYDFTREVRSLYSEKIPIIACSASVSSSDKDLAIAAGCNDFIPKPVEMEILFLILEKYLQIQWNYDVNHSTSSRTQEQSTKVPVQEMVFPTSAELNKLYEASRIGDIDMIKSEAERLSQSNPQYQPFTDRIIELADQFDDVGIIQMIKSIINSEIT